MQYYKQLDGLRAIAIIGVMIFHWLYSKIDFVLLKNIPFGSGVTLFFVLSGFLITLIILNFKEENIANGRSHFKSIKAFYIRRSLRIFPIYYLTILFLLAIDFQNTKELFYWLSSYTSNVYMTIHSKYLGHYTHFWSLAVEEQFYLIWVFVLLISPRKYLKSTIVLFICLSILCDFYFKFYTSYWLANSLVICQIYTLGAGALIAYYVKYRKEYFRKLNISTLKSITVTLILLYILIFVFRKPDALFANFKAYKHIAITIIHAFIVLIAVKNGFNGLVKVILENKVMVYIGKISYGLYVYHAFMTPLYYNIIQKYLGIGEINATVLFCIFFMLNLILATLSWYLIEKPINSLKKYFKY